LIIETTLLDRVRNTVGNPTNKEGSTPVAGETMEGGTAAGGAAEESTAAPPKTKSFIEEISEYAGRLYGQAKAGLSRGSQTTEQEATRAKEEVAEGAENAKEEVKEGVETVKEEAIKTKDAAASSWAKG
jgi:hypothetical protein